MRSLLPTDIKNALIQVCGCSFWYKDPLFDIFERAGVPKRYYSKYKDEPKFKMARHLLDDLEVMGDEGGQMQRRLVAELCNLRGLPDPGVQDRDAGLRALRELKQTVIAHQSAAQKESEHARQRIAEKPKPQSAGNRLEQLNERFKALLHAQSDSERQARGYDLEDILVELFALSGIEYKPSYRTQDEQIDGAFNFDGANYLVEARWRKDAPTRADLAAFKTKVDHKMFSPRGLFLSMAGFRQEVIDYMGQGCQLNILFMDGYDLTLILEGRIGLHDALRTKVDKAYQEGVSYFSLGKLF